MKMDERMAHGYGLCSIKQNMLIEFLMDYCLMILLLNGREYFYSFLYFSKLFKGISFISLFILLFSLSFYLSLYLMGFMSSLRFPI